MEDSVNNKILKYHQQLRRLRDPYGRNITDQFKKLPSKDEDPSYYDRVNKPISFLMIRNRIDKQKYQSVNQWIFDVELLIRNARLLSDGNEQVISDINEMQKFLDVQKKIHFPPPTGPQQLKPEEYNFSGSGHVKSPGFPPQNNRQELPYNLSQVTHNNNHGFPFQRSEFSFPQLKFLHNFTHNNTTYSSGDEVLLINIEDGNNPLIAKLHRLWKCNNYYGAISTLFIRPSTLLLCNNKSLLDEQSPILENEIFACSLFKIHFSHEIFGKCSINFNKDSLNHGMAVDGFRFNCYRYFDVPRSRFYTLNPSYSFITMLQAALDERKAFKYESRKVYCTFSPTCERSFNSLDGLLKHSGDHVLKAFSLSSNNLSRVFSSEPISILYKRLALPFGGNSHGSPYASNQFTNNNTQYNNLISEMKPESSQYSDYPFRFSSQGASHSKALPQTIENLFQKNAKGEVLWFPSPPLDVLLPKTPLHSLEYISYKQAASQKTS